MVDDGEIAKAAQPVGEDDASRGDGLHLGAGFGADEDPLPGRAAILAWSAETADKFPARRQGKAPLQPREGVGGERGVRRALVAQGRPLCRRGGPWRGDDAAEALDQPGQTPFVAPEPVHLAPLRLDAVGEAGQQRLALLLLLDQRGAFALLALFDLRQFGAFLARLFGEPLLFLEDAAEFADQAGLGAGEQAQVVGVARQLVGIVAREEVAQGVAFAGVELACEQPPQLGLLSGDARREPARLGVEAGQGGLDGGPPGGQLAQRAIRLGNGLLGLAQFLGGVGAGFLGLGDVLLQGADAALQVLQLLASDVGRRREDARRGPCNEQEKPLVQCFALPWLATACMAAATAAGSPR